jgi:hypothetical protein
MACAGHHFPSQPSRRSSLDFDMSSKSAVPPVVSPQGQSFVGAGRFGALLSAQNAGHQLRPSYEPSYVAARGSQSDMSQMTNNLLSYGAFSTPAISQAQPETQLMTPQAAPQALDSFHLTELLFPYQAWPIGDIDGGLIGATTGPFIPITSQSTRAVDPVDITYLIHSNPPLLEYPLTNGWPAPQLEMAPTQMAQASQPGVGPVQGHTFLNPEATEFEPPEQRR